MLSVVIPTLNAGRSLATCLSALVPGSVAGLIKDVVIVDGGSDDETTMIADATGAEVVHSRKGRGHQLAQGATAARADWLLFLHADTVLETGWEREVRDFMDQAAEQGDIKRAASFRFKLNTRGPKARLLERLVAMRCAVLALPFGDQGLLISRRLYDEIGGYAELPLMEDVDIIGRIGRRRLTVLRHVALTSAERYARDGFVLRSLRNFACLTLYYLRVPPRVLLRIYNA
ncbi:MAG: TIGR04283 family arsenosugar biosynthesis glycosyltransferase [Hyphomicrobiales bacterium]